MEVSSGTPASGWRLHHVGVAVPSIAAAREEYKSMGFDAVTPVYEDLNQKVRVQFVSTGTEVTVELIEPASEDSPISRFLKKQGKGLNHLCYEVGDVRSACNYARSNGGIITCEPIPAVAYDDRLIAFVYWHGSIIEFLQRAQQ